MYWTYLIPYQKWRLRTFIFIILVVIPTKRFWLLKNIWRGTLCLVDEKKSSEEAQVGQRRRFWESELIVCDLTITVAFWQWYFVNISEIGWNLMISNYWYNYLCRGNPCKKHIKGPPIVKTCFKNTISLSFAGVVEITLVLCYSLVTVVVSDCVILKPITHD